MIEVRCVKSWNKFKLFICKININTSSIQAILQLELVDKSSFIYQ